MSLATAAATSPPAQVIAGRYRVIRLLGQGGMGAVYQVEELASGAQLALKRLAADADERRAALFEREYHALAGLRHRCIVEVYDYGRDELGAFYTMELIEGRDLTHGVPIDWREGCRLLRDAASILGVLHARELLHRDLSPRNLMWTADRRLKLIDFGALTSFGVNRELVGTPPFVAPEALRQGALDGRTDLFALGALAYWLITGVHAFPARSLNELPRVWEHEPLAPSELLAATPGNALAPIPVELDALVRALLRIEQSERLGSTAELIDRLNAVAELEPEANDDAVLGYLESKAFVGRARERERALTALGAAALGSVQTVLIEGEAGVGRTRFLQELTVLSRLKGALPLVADDAGERSFGVAETLLRAAVRALPVETRQAVSPHAGALAALSPALREALRIEGPQLSGQGAADSRVRTLGALREIFLGLSRDRMLALVVDDLQNVDEESQALLTALAHAGEGARLAIFMTLARDDNRDVSGAIAQLREAATCV